MIISLKMVLIFILWGSNITQEVTIDHAFLATPTNLIENMNGFLLMVSNQAKATLTGQPCVKLTAVLSVSEVVDGLPYDLPVAAADIDDTLDLEIRPELIRCLVDTGVLEQ